MTTIPKRPASSITRRRRAATEQDIDCVDFIAAKQVEFSWVNVYPPGLFRTAVAPMQSRCRGQPLHIQDQRPKLELIEPTGNRIYPHLPLDLTQDLQHDKAKCHHPQVPLLHAYPW
jgi:hypothetical protein